MMSWVISHVPIEHHPTIRYMVYNGYYFWWCPIYPKWDSYQPLYIEKLPAEEKRIKILRNRFKHSHLRIYICSFHVCKHNHAYITYNHINSMCLHGKYLNMPRICFIYNYMHTYDYIRAYIYISHILYMIILCSRNLAHRFTQHVAMASSCWVWRHADLWLEPQSNQTGNHIAA